MAESKDVKGWLGLEVIGEPVGWLNGSLGDWWQFCSVFGGGNNQ